ncbi:conserved hypothetical protein [Mesorhizobium plurifarium]|uniref:HEAT repeat domain-containing protein n=1 Tax=Mesorhizobium plurifarium TaxID=69974 RepID=A0A090E388_MESPL|nr:conserved hypothetical protein [Mesorhizobium plurifarium]
MNIDDIRSRAQGVRQGGVSPAELEYARNILISGVGDISSALYIVGYCGEGSDYKIIERYLQPDKADTYGELALTALCRYLRQIDRYRPYIKRILLGPKEPWANAKMAAIHLSYEYLKDYTDDEFVRKLRSIMLDENDADRASARNELVRILGLKGELKDPFKTEFDNIEDDTIKIVEAADKRFFKNK